MGDKPAPGPFHSQKHCLLHQGKPIIVRVWIGSEGFRRLRLPGVIDTRHKRVIILSSLRTGRLYPPGNISGTNFS